MEMETYSLYEIYKDREEATLLSSLFKAISFYCNNKGHNKTKKLM